MAWKDLGLRDKAPFLRMAAKHGVTNLDAIRSAYDTLGANTMASGGTMRKKKERPKVDLLSRSKERNLRNGYKQWISRIESYFGGLSDDYDYEGYYRADPEEAWRQLARLESGKAPHFPDTYKKRNHATYPDRGSASWNKSQDTFYPSDRQMEDSDRILDYLGSDANYKNGGANVSYAGGKVLPTVYVSPKGNDVDMRPNKQGTGYVYKDRSSEYALGGRLNKFDDGGREDIIDWGMIDLKAIRDKYKQLEKEKSDGYTAVPASRMSYNEGNGLWWDSGTGTWHSQGSLTFPGGELDEVPVVGHRSYRYPVPYDASYNLWDDVSTDELAKYVDAAQDPVRYLVNGWNNHIQYGAGVRDAIKGEYSAMTRHYKNLADQYGLNYKPEYTPEEFAEHLDINWADPWFLVTRDKYGHLSPTGAMGYTSMERGPHGLHEVSISPAFGRGFPENRIVPTAVHEARHVADNTGLSSTFGLTRDLASFNNASQQKESKRGWDLMDELMEKRHPVSPAYEQAFHDVYPLYGISLSGDIFDSAAERMATHSEIQYRLAKRFGLDPNSDDFGKEFAKAVRNMPDDWILQDDDGQLKFPLLFDDDGFPINGYAQNMIPVLSRFSQDASKESPAKGKEWRDNYVKMMRDVLTNVRAHGGSINMFDGVSNLGRPNQLTTAFDDLVAARDRYAQTGDIGTSWEPVDLNDVSITDNGFITREGRTGDSFVLPEATIIGQRPVVNEAILEEKPDDNSFLGRLRAARNRVKYGHSTLTKEDKAMIRRGNKVAAAGSAAIAGSVLAPYLLPYAGTALNAMQPSTYLDAIASSLGAQVGNYGLGASTMAGALGNAALASDITAEGLGYLYNTYLNGNNPRSFGEDLNASLALAPFLAAPAAGAKKLVDLSRNSGRLMTRLGRVIPEIERAIGLPSLVSRGVSKARDFRRGYKLLKSQPLWSLLKHESLPRTALRHPNRIATIGGLSDYGKELVWWRWPKDYTSDQMRAVDEFASREFPKVPYAKGLTGVSPGNPEDWAKNLQSARNLLEHFHGDTYPYRDISPTDVLGTSSWINAYASNIRSLHRQVDIAERYLTSHGIAPDPGLRGFTSRSFAPIELLKDPSKNFAGDYDISGEFMPSSFEGQSRMHPNARVRFNLYNIPSEEGLSDVFRHEFSHALHDHPGFKYPFSLVDRKMLSPEEYRAYAEGLPEILEQSVTDKEAIYLPKELHDLLHEAMPVPHGTSNGIELAVEKSAVLNSVRDFTIRQLGLDSVDAGYDTWQKAVNGLNSEWFVYLDHKGKAHTIYDRMRGFGWGDIYTSKLSQKLKQLVEDKPELAGKYANLLKKAILTVPMAAGVVAGASKAGDSNADTDKR